MLKSSLAVDAIIFVEYSISQYEGSSDPVPAIWSPDLGEQIVKPVVAFAVCGRIFCKEEHAFEMGNPLHIVNHDGVIYS